MACTACQQSLRPEPRRLSASIQDSRFSMPNPCGQHDSDESTTKQEIICHLSSVLMPPLPKFAISRSASPMIDPAVPAGGRGLLRPRHYLMAPAPAINAHPLEDGTPAFLLSLPNIGIRPGSSTFFFFFPPCSFLVCKQLPNFHLPA